VHATFLLTLFNKAWLEGVKKVQEGLNGPAMQA
jgi:hypothetical protein